MKKVRITAVAILASLCIGAMVSCSGSGEADVSSEVASEVTTTTTEAAATTTTTTTTAADNSSDKKNTASTTKGATTTTKKTTTTTTKSDGGQAPGETMTEDEYRQWLRDNGIEPWF